MDIYANWIPSSAYYAVHLLLWMLPIALLQWVGFGRLLWANRKPIFATTLILGTYLIATDVVAVGFGVWHFDDALILGFSPGGVPIEEWLFFYLTVLIVVQSFILFLPRPLRYNPPVTSE